MDRRCQRSPQGAREEHQGNRAGTRQEQRGERAGTTRSIWLSPLDWSGNYILGRGKKASGRTSQPRGPGGERCPFMWRGGSPGSGDHRRSPARLLYFLTPLHQEACNPLHTPLPASCRSLRASRHPAFYAVMLEGLPWPPQGHRGWHHDRSRAVTADRFFGMLETA